MMQISESLALVHAVAHPRLVCSCGISCSKIASFSADSSLSPASVLRRSQCRLCLTASISHLRLFEPNNAKVAVTDESYRWKHATYVLCDELYLAKQTDDVVTFFY